jgi:hypothetical protein
MSLAALWPLAARADTNDVVIVTNPLPQESYVRLEPMYTFLDDGGEESQLLVRGVFTYRGWFVPGWGPSSAACGWRLDLPIQHVGTSTLHATGLGKLALTQLSGVIVSWGAFGAGVEMALPTQTNAAFGAGDVQVGPSLYGYVSVIPHVPVSLIASSLFATGDSPAIETILEPTVSVELGETFSLVSNGTIAIDWFAHGARVPVNLRLGYTVSDHWYLEAGPEIVAAGSSRGDVTLGFELDYFL